MRGNNPRRRLLVVALATLTLLAPAARANEDEPVPWPTGSPPTEETLTAMVDDARAFADRERREEFLEAREHGEAREHMTAFQWDIDDGRLDADALFLVGDAFFEHAFERIDGLGATVDLRPPQRVHTSVRGGLDSFSCAGCHSVGGPDGAGSETQNALLFGDGDRASSAIVRNPPMVLGPGLVQALAWEMTVDLRAARDAARDRAVATGLRQQVTLTSKGVSFGSLVVEPDGRVDARGVLGVDADLEVRPFGWKGTVARLRRFAEDAARVHFGVQAHTLALRHQVGPDPALLGNSVDWWDPDGDGVQRELEEGTITAAAVYMAMLEIPVEIPPASAALRERATRGRVLFTTVGCADCHRPSLHLDSSRWLEASDTTTASPFVLDLLQDGDAPRGTLDVALYSDLRRHDMGPALADARNDPSGVPAAVFLTRPLWGLAESAPYLHDGRAATIPEAILAHGGDALPSRDAFAALSAEAQADVHVFLLTLTRTPRPRVAR